MTPSAAIMVEALWKQYRLGVYGRTSFREALTKGITRALPGRKPDDGRDFWALREVSFAIAAGEMVGVVGDNGAGKSTLLKILSRITPPTLGTVRFRGRIGSLLEVGTGFHPELSGRDNVFLNGIILGMSRREVARRFEEIVAFAEIASFIDTPVKRYSSGMYLRLAFAVAAHLDTDILIVDEVLAVGDVAFQKKCLARMNEVARGGRTVLFVSHNLIAVQTLCDRVIWMQRGTVVGDGPAREILSSYLRTAGGPSSASDRTWSRGEGPTGGNVQVLQARVRPARGQPGEPIDVKTSFVIEFLLDHTGSTKTVNTAITVVNGQDILVLNVGPPGEPVAWSPGIHRLQCEIPGDLLNDGGYRIGLEVIQGGTRVLEVPEILNLNILDSEADRHGWYGKWDGVVRPRFAWTHERIEDPSYRLP